MFPELFRLGSFSISSFGVMMVLAFVAAYWQLRRALIATGTGDEEDASSLVFAGGVGGIVGAKAYYALLYGDWKLLFDRSGLVWYGGFLLATVAVVWVIRRRSLAPWRTFDAATLGLALGYAVGRVGCFLVGDDYGVPTELPWGVAFPEGLPPTTAGVLRRSFEVDIPASVADGQVLAVHPTQLYETALALIVWGIGLALFRRWQTPGKTGLLVVAALAVERFGVEFLRAKDDRFFGLFTVAQGISVAVVVVAMVLLLRRDRAHARRGDT
ncbi:MAG: prolipoprotein diacylglyceryl transferase [Acidobacteriota bacterium]